MTIPEKHILKTIVTLSKRLVAIPSTSDNPEALRKVLETAKHELQGHFPMEEFENKGISSVLIHNTNKRTKHFKILFNVHLDVLPGNAEQFYPKDTNGKLIGRGTYDIKGAAAAIIILFKQIARDITYPLGLQLTTDEEIGGHNGTVFQIEKGIRADFVIAAECASNLNLKTQAKGFIWLKLNVKGRDAHGAHPWDGDNALWKLYGFLYKLQELYPIPVKETWVSTINVARIETPNKAFNRVPSEASAYLDIRFLPGERDKVLENISNLLSSDMEIQTILDESYHFTDPENPYIKVLKKKTGERTNREVKFLHADGGSDARHFSNVGCNGIEFGPIGANQHANNEWVDIQSLEDYYHILKQFLLSLKML